MEQKGIYTQWWFWLLMLVGGGAVLAIFHFLKKGLTNPQAQPQKYSYTDPETGETKTVSFAPEPHTDALRNAIYDYQPWLNWVGRDMTPFTNFLNMEDGKFVAICTDWNKRWKSDGNETLRVAIQGESLPWVDGKDISALLEAKFIRLNII